MADALLLSRLQYAWVIAWHILLPAFTVGLSSYIALMETLYFVGKNKVYLNISAFWTRIFSVAFGMGVVSGITLPFQFGTNWSRFSDATANVLSPMLAYEGLTAFFLEAGFLGVLLFGRNRVPPWAHLVSALMVALGTLISTFWIISVNSWMQTPAGYQIIDGRFFPLHWMQVVFNPSFPFRLAHSVVAFYVTTGFVVAGVAAWLLRKKRHVPEATKMLSTTLWLLLVLVPLQFVLGDIHGLNTREHQPAKLAAIEARWETARRAPLTLFAIPDQANQRNRFAVEVPLLGSLILAHDPNGEIKGLKDFPRDQQPTVILPFFAFRAMVGLGMLMLALVLWGNVLRRGGRLYQSRLFLRTATWTAPIGFVAVIAGWVTTETGRQPWTVYGLLRTSQSVSPSLTGADVLISLAAYVVVYLILYLGGLIVMGRMVSKGPVAAGAEAPVGGGRSAKPITAKTPAKGKNHAGS